MSNPGKRTIVVASVLVSALLGGAPTMASITIETVSVGDLGNQGELSGAGAGGYGPDRICGAVAYPYSIGKYEVTNAQYASFLSAKGATGDPYGLYNASSIIRTGAGTQSDPWIYQADVGAENKPVCYVSFWDAARFANWLHNGQGDGDTETGSYTLEGYVGSDGAWVVRNPGATWVLPNEDEWYKAAFYKGGDANAGYWDYATRSDTAPVAEPPPGGVNSANHRHQVGDITPVGAYPASVSPYGTFDQNGNLWEWVEDVVTGTMRGTRGSAWASDVINGDIYAHSSFRNYTFPDDYNVVLGFRVARVPEPATLSLLALGGLSLVRRRRA